MFAWISGAIVLNILEGVTMKAKDVPVGSRVKYDAHDPAWCLGKVINSGIDFILLGWKPGEPASGWRNSLSVDKPTIDMLEKAGCDHAWLIGLDSEVTIISKAVVSNKFTGMTCKRCFDFAPFAEANRPDGKSFVCYSCRNSWLPADF